jgi:dolichol-phosphate mannosyltransferase
MTLSPHKIGRVSVLLPTYNEAGNIADLVVEIDRAISYPHEIIVVDDNSPDGTSNIIHDLIASGRISSLRLETRTSDRGLTKSLKRGIELATGDTVVWMDCDFSMPPKIIPSLLQKIEEGHDIAVGSRFVKGGGQKTGDDLKSAGESPLAIGLSNFLNLLSRILLLPGFHDFTSGFIAVRKSVLDQIPLRGDYGEYFMDLMVRAHKKKFRWIEIPYICEPRRSGESKTAPNLHTLVRRGVRYLLAVARLFFVRFF